MDKHRRIYLSLSGNGRASALLAGSAALHVAALAILGLVARIRPPSPRPLPSISTSNRAPFSRVKRRAAQPCRSGLPPRYRPGPQIDAPRTRTGFLRPLGPLRNQPCQRSLQPSLLRRTRQQRPSPARFGIRPSDVSSAVYPWMSRNAAIAVSPRAPPALRRFRALAGRNGTLASPPRARKPLPATKTSAVV